LAQAKTITDQQAAHKIIYDGAKVTYDELTTLRQQVKDKIAALKGEATGQKEAVETLTDKIKTALVIQWEALIKRLGEENDKIIGAAQAQFDQIKAELLKGELYGRSHSPYTLTSMPQIIYKCVILSQLQSTTCPDMCLILT